MAWFDIYRAYDDESLTVLTNAGLLRRAGKDTEAGRLAWLENSEENGAITVDGQRVELDSKGIRQARCDCPAPGICRHILAAVLWIRKLPVPPTVAPQEVPASAEHLPDPAHPERQDALADLLSLEPASVFKQAGKAAVRQAVALLNKEPTLALAELGRTLAISMPELGFHCRFVTGTGFEGMISETTKSSRKMVHLTALLLVWRLHGKPFDLPVGITSELCAPETALTVSEIQFLGQVRRLLDDLISNGLSHVNGVTAGHLQALNMSARGEGMPRLAAMLRSLGETINLLAQRDFRADEHQALHQMAKICALCAAMVQPVVDLAVLRGRLHTEYSLQEETELLSLGGYWWENRSGARGLTLLFWDFSKGKVLRSTQARPDDSDPTFKCASLWSLRPVWPGSGSAEQLCRGTVRFSQARLSDDGQIAGGGDARAVSDKPWIAADPRLDQIGEDDWLALIQHLRKTVGLTSYQDDYLLLRPKRVERPIINEVTQVLEWNIVDRKGQRLLLQLECSPANAKRIANLEQVVSRNADIRVVAVRVTGDHRGLAFEPLTVLVAEAGVIRPVSLDFAEEKAEKTNPLLARIKRIIGGHKASAPAVREPTLAARVLIPVLNVLEMLADTGRRELTEIQRETLLRQQSQANAVGLELPAALIGDLTSAATVSPARLLRLYFVSRRCLYLDGLPVVK